MRIGKKYKVIEEKLNREANKASKLKEYARKRKKTHKLSAK